MNLEVLEEVTHIYVGESVCVTAYGEYHVETGLYRIDWDGEVVSFQGSIGDYFGNTEKVVLTPLQLQEMIEEGSATLFKEHPAGGAAKALEEIEG